MSAVTLGQAGVNAIEQRDWTTAIQKLTLALESSPSPTWLIARSTALIAIGDAQNALTDAELAYHVAADRGNRALMADAQFRRGVALLRQDKFADADVCWALTIGMAKSGNLSDGDEQLKRIDENGNYNVTVAEVERLLQEGFGPKPGHPILKEKGLTEKDSAAKKLWNRCSAMRIRCLQDMAKTPEDHPGRKITISRIPPRPARPAQLQVAGSVSTGAKKDSEASPAKEAATEGVQNAGNAASAVTPAPSVSKPPPLRVDAYETDTHQTVSIFVKKADPASLKIEWPRPSVMTLKFHHGDTSEVLTLKLSGDAVPDQVTSRVISMKIELQIAKVTPGKWTVPKIQESSEDTAEPSAPTKPGTTGQAMSDDSKNNPSATATQAPREPATSSPAYPTSSKTGPKNWDTILQDNEDEDAEEGSKDPEFWFKQLYANATPEQRRAMMKSFTESNGTALSTDWADVSKGPVETKPPEGVEVKKWDE